MKKFEVGKRYGYGAHVVEVISRTPKFVTVAQVYHVGRFNEKVEWPKKVRIKDWETEEVIFHGYEEYHALEEYIA